MNEIKMTNGKRATNEGISLSLSLCPFLSLSIADISKICLFFSPSPLEKRANKRKEFVIVGTSSACGF